MKSFPFFTNIRRQLPLLAALLLPLVVWLWPRHPSAPAKPTPLVNSQSPKTKATAEKPRPKVLSATVQQALQLVPYRKVRECSSQAMAGCFTQPAGTPVRLDLAGISLQGTLDAVSEDGEVHHAAVALENGLGKAHRE